MIANIFIKNFRTFEQLEVQSFGRVNLIVGRNNIGKTALMEAIQFYIRGADSQNLVRYLSEKDEVISLENRNYGDEIFGVNFASLFHRGKVGYKEIDPICIFDTSDKNNALTIYATQIPLRRRHFMGIGVSNNNIAEELSETVDVQEDNIGEFAIVIEKGDKSDYATLDDAVERQFRIKRNIVRRKINKDLSNIMTVPSNSISQNEIARLWDSISLTDSEENVLSLIRMVAPVSRVSFVQKTSSRSDRIVILKLDNQPHPVPLKSMGEGIARIIQIALVLESNMNTESYTATKSLFDTEGNRESYLFIDELENGIHYSVLDEIWEFIFSIAESKNIQVFVTSHSWDCFESFQRVARKFDSSGVLINIREKNNLKVATCFSEDELHFISKNSIEVR